MLLTDIRTDETLQELQRHGQPGFPFAFYDEHVRQFHPGYIDWHWHSEVEWVYVAAGSVDCLAGAQRVRLTAGDGIFFNSRAIHRMESPGDAHIPNLLFRPEFLAPHDSPVYRQAVAPIVASGLLCLPLRAQNEADRPLLALLRAALQAAQQDDALAIQLSVLALWQAFARAYGAAFAHSAAGRDTVAQARARAMVQFIAEHYAQKLTLAQIAAAAGVSKSEALRCFHKALQATPVQFLLRYRLDQARARLLATDDTVTRIAVECGIENVSYFVRQFAARFGATPNAFRRQYRR